MNVRGANVIHSPTVCVSVGCVDKDFNLGYNFQTIKNRAFKFHMCISLWQDLSHGTIIFDLVALTLKFDILLKDFNLGNNFQRSDMACILHICIPCDKTFHIVPLFFYLVTLTLKLTYFWKTLTLAITFKPEEMGLSYCTIMCIICDKTFHMVP